LSACVTSMTASSRAFICSDTERMPSKRRLNSLSLRMPASSAARSSSSATSATSSYSENTNSRSPMRRRSPWKILDLRLPLPLTPTSGPWMVATPKSRPSNTICAWKSDTDAWSTQMSLPTPRPMVVIFL
jgi:hypothetical protein